MSETQTGGREHHHLETVQLKVQENASTPHQFDSAKAISTPLHPSSFRAILFPDSIIPVVNHGTDNRPLLSSSKKHALFIQLYPGPTR